MSSDTPAITPIPNVTRYGNAYTALMRGKVCTDPSVQAGFSVYKLAGSYYFTGRYSVLPAGAKLITTYVENKEQK